MHDREDSHLSIFWIWNLKKDQFFDHFETCFNGITKGTTIHEGWMTIRYVCKIKRDAMPNTFYFMQIQFQQTRKNLESARRKVWS